MPLGERESGLRELEKGVDLSGRSSEALSRLGWAYGLIGRREEALRIADEMKKKLQLKTASPFRIGYVYAGLGDRDEALRWFDRALQEHDFFLVEVNAIPGDFDSWRSDPRFQQLLRGMNLAAQ